MGRIWVQTVTWGWCISENWGMQVLRAQKRILSPHTHFPTLLQSAVPFPSCPGHVTSTSHAGSAFPGEWAVLCSKNLPLGASRVTKGLSTAGSFPCRVQTHRQWATVLGVTDTLLSPRIFISVTATVLLQWKFVISGSIMLIHWSHWCKSL